MQILQRKLDLLSHKQKEQTKGAAEPEKQTQETDYE